MNINFGLLPEINQVANKKYLKGRDKKKVQSNIAINAFKKWVEQL